MLQRSYRAVAQSVGEARHDVRDYLRALGAGGGVVERAALAVSEAATNVVLHAYIGHDAPREFHVLAEVVDEATGRELCMRFLLSVDHTAQAARGTG